MITSVSAKYIFLAIKAAEQNHLYEFIPFYYTQKFSFLIVFFFKIVFIPMICISLKHIAFEIIHYQTTRGWEKLDLKQTGG